METLRNILEQEGLILSIMLMGGGLFLFIINWALDIDNEQAKFKARFVPLCKVHKWTTIKDPLNADQNYLMCSVCKRIPGQDEGAEL